MRTLAITSMLAGVAFIATSSAHAATFSVPIHGSGSFTISNDLDIFAGDKALTLTFTPPVFGIPEQPPQRTGSVVWSNITVDQATNHILSLSETGAGATLTATPLKSVTTGGSITITDLTLDLFKKQVKATVIGGNGVGTLTDFTLWNIDPATVLPLTYSPGASFSGQTLGLSITQEGLTTFTQALGLLPLAKTALAGVQSYGSISWNFTTPAVPEASTWAMTLLGLSAIGAAVQRRRKQA